MNWDWVITVTIIVFLGLALWARIGRQTIPELLRDISDYFKEKKEEAIEPAIDI